MNKALALAFLALTATLVIGARFGFTWAGGTGYSPSLPVTVAALQNSMDTTAYADRNGTVRALANGSLVARGERITTDAGTRLALSLETGAKIVLDERSEITLEMLQPDEVDIQLVKGRVFAVAGTGQKVVVDTNATQLGILQNAMTVVNYDFLQTIEAAPFRTSLAAVDGQSGFVTNHAVKIHETDPVSVTDETFDAGSSTAADFYTWAEKQTGFTLP